MAEPSPGSRFATPSPDEAARLDREIATGLRPDSDAARGLRAQQLTSMPERRRVALCVANILEAADARHAQPGARLTAIDAQVLAARRDLVGLIDAIRGERAVSARGVALARQLVESGGSPLVRSQARLTAQQAGIGGDRSVLAVSVDKLRAWRRRRYDPCR